MCALTDNEKREATEAIRQLAGVPMGNAGHYYLEMLASILQIELDEGEC